MSNSNYKTMQTKTIEQAKQDAIREWVAREFNAVPQEWVRKVMEADADHQPLPMWGTMWIVNAHLGEKFMQRSRVMAGDASEIDIKSIEDENLPIRLTQTPTTSRVLPLSRV